MAHENLRCLVMSADMVPVSVIKSLHALVHVLEDKVFIIEEHKDVRYHSEKADYPAPAIVCHKRYRNLPNYYYPTATLTLENLKIRDQYTCQYCGKTELSSGERWEKEHIMPASRGGELRWENIVLACTDCNQRKQDRTPEEAGMTLLRRPMVPTRWHLELLRRRKK